jgi:plastocyanin
MAMRVVLAALAAVAGLGLGYASPAAAATFTVHVFDNEFSPDPTIRVGDTVEWVWDSGFHSSTSVRNIPEQWDSGIIGPGSEFSHTFTRVGTWNYYCIPHGFDNGNGTASGMTGRITVLVPEPGAATLFAAATASLLLRRRTRAPRSPASASR